ncbi:hypothetical protein KFL_001070120 [Klebsormidium nitens]|uniref:Uncharacterized protein n=1 Tax=Klebsormidium nitens TaxID=105231 RepID=A0A1Y1I0K9_KLENI|nr:hypothetical protein KFL_001070120 [Klebsormidium nitens]|eukprot:GAQ82306.1 hypothetical protein KFL_001070120 [Klebsormidium nitens]
MAPIKHCFASAAAGILAVLLMGSTLALVAAQQGGAVPQQTLRIARVNITNACVVPVRIQLGSNQANNDFWQTYDPATNTTTPANGTYDIPVGGSQGNLLLVKIDGARALPNSSFSIGAFAPTDGPAPNLIDTIAIRSQLGTTPGTLPESSPFNGGAPGAPPPPGIFSFNPVTTNTSSSTVAPVEIAVAVICAGLLPPLSTALPEPFPVLPYRAIPCTQPAGSECLNIPPPSSPSSVDRPASANRTWAATLRSAMLPAILTSSIAALADGASPTATAPAKRTAASASAAECATVSQGPL